MQSFYTTHFTKKNTPHLQLITMQSGTPLAVQCSSSRAYCYFQRVSMCLSLHGLAFCNWADMPAVFVAIKFSCPRNV